LVSFQAVTNGVDCSLWIRISDKPCMHALCHMHSTWLGSHLPLFLNSDIWCQVQFMKLRLCQFLQFPIIFSHKVYRFISIVSKHNFELPTYVYTSNGSSSERQKDTKHYEAEVWVSPNSTHLNFFTLQSSLLNATQEYYKLPNISKLQTIYWVDHIFGVCNSHWNTRTKNKKRNVTRQWYKRSRYVTLSSSVPMWSFQRVLVT
jgi:hypothetical protein